MDRSRRERSTAAKSGSRDAETARPMTPRLVPHAARTKPLTSVRHAAGRGWTAAPRRSGRAPPPAFAGPGARILRSRQRRICVRQGAQSGEVAPYPDPLLRSRLRLTSPVVRDFKRAGREFGRGPLLIRARRRMDLRHQHGWLAAVIEAVSGNPLDQFPAPPHFDPLAMIDTGYSVRPSSRPACCG